MANPVSLILTDHNGNTLQVTGATVLTPAQRQALGLMLSQPLSAVLCDVNGNPLQLTSSGGSGAWASLTGDLTETQVIPWDGGTVGTPDSGISRIGAASLAIGNAVAGNTSGSLTLSSLYASLVDTVAVTLTGVFTDGVGSVGTNGQVLSSTVTGTKWITAASGGVTSITGDGTIISNSGSTGAVTLTLENAAQNSVLAGPTSGSGTPSYRSLVAADVANIFASPSAIGSTTPAAGSFTTLSASSTFSVTGASTFTGNGTSTLGTATPGTSTSTAGFDLLQNTTPTVTGATTSVALSTSTAPTNPSGNNWVYTLAATETGAGSNGWVNASVTLSGYTGGATGNNGTFIITASTTTTITITNASGTTTNTGTTPVMISSAVVNSPILQIAGTVNTGTAGTLNSVADVWSIQNIIGSVGPNPTSTLTFTHTGSSGTAAVSVTQLNVTTVNASSGNLILNSASGEVIFEIGSTAEFLVQSTSFRGGNASIIGFSSAAAPTGAAADTGISRSAAGVIAIGTGSTGSTAGTIAMTEQLFTASASAPTSAGTAGTAGQIIYNGTNLYICTVTGAAGSATWSKFTLTSV